MGTVSWVFCWSKALCRENEKYLRVTLANTHEINLSIEVFFFFYATTSQQGLIMLTVEAKHGFRRDLGYRRALLNQSAYLSSLAMSPCCESSSISGKLVMMSRWISTGATDTSCISLLPKSCTHAWTRYATQMSCQHTQGWYTKQSRANLFNGFYLFIGAILPNIVHVCIRFKSLACWQYDTELIHKENICSLFHYFVCTKDPMVRGAAVRERETWLPL